MFGALVINAVKFVPQSRPRLFMVAALVDARAPLKAEGPSDQWHPAPLRAAQKRLVGPAADNWVWWNLPAPPKPNESFLDLIEDEPSGVQWHTQQETLRLLALMSPLNLEKLRLAKLSNQRIVGGVYKRTRLDQDGRKTQRAEVRFDDISGCLRTPSGGSSRQTIVLVEGARVRSRLLSPREAARLMGLPKSYVLPDNYNEAYHLAGDGVVVPVVRFLADKLIEPLLGSGSGDKRKKAA
jgi:DNA (cytosine-5)-methyltransferase 1